MCQLCEEWGVNLHADEFGATSSDFAIALPSDGPANFIVGDRGWTDNGSSSGSSTASTGGPGGVIAWSLAGPGLTDNSSGRFFEGSSVSLGGFLPFNYQSVLRSAFATWSVNANIEFIQVQDNGGKIGVGAYPTIRIVAGDIDGPSRILGRANQPSSTPYGGDIVFDSGDSAFLSNQHNFFLVALHEIGHALGLSHEPEIPALMNPVINTALSGLTIDDINGIRSLYGAQDNGATTYYMPSSLANLTILDNTHSLMVIGNALNNSIVGAHAIETINGGGGDDTLATGGGLDTLIGGTGSDTYIIEFAMVNVVERAGEGTDTVRASVDFTLPENVEKLTLTGEDNINGTGNSGDNTITGNAHDNVLNGGTGGLDTLIGGLGDDTYVVDHATVTVIEDADAGTDKVKASVTFALGANIENLTLTGSNAVNGTGNSADNAITGNDDDNTLSGGNGGVDTLTGGTGNDTYIVDHTTVTVIESTGAGTDTVRASIDFFLGANFENLILTGSASINGFGNDLANVIEGNTGSNVLLGGDGADTLSGGGNADYLLIDGSDTAIDGGAGFDSVFVQTAAPVTLDMGASSVEWVLGNAGNDTFNAASQTGAVYIYGMGGDDTLTGSAFGDYLDGVDGSDILEGGDGADLMLGNGGSDILRGQGGDDSIIELGGDSVIDGGTGFDSLFVWSDTGVTLDLTAASIEWVQGSVPGDDTLDAAGNTVNTFLYGWGGNDTLTAGSADDYIAGGAGDDVLTGGAGNDTMIGETGFDRYVYTAATWGSDTIHSFDFNGETLDFTAVAEIDSFSDFATYEWDPLGLGYNSTTLFYTSGGTTSAITLIGVQTASLSDADFLFA
jgi:Ca2+-binding RTX toxin-like protein